MLYPNTISSPHSIVYPFPFSRRQETSAATYDIVKREGLERYIKQLKSEAGILMKWKNDAFFAVLMLSEAIEAGEEAWQKDVLDISQEVVQPNTLVRKILKEFANSRYDLAKLERLERYIKKLNHEVAFLGEVHHFFPLAMQMLNEAIEVAKKARPKYDQDIQWEVVQPDIIVREILKEAAIGPHNSAKKEGLERYKQNLLYEMARIGGVEKSLPFAVQMLRDAIEAVEEAWPKNRDIRGKVVQCNGLVGKLLEDVAAATDDSLKKEELDRFIKKFKSEVDMLRDFKNYAPFVMQMLSEAIETAEKARPKDDASVGSSSTLISSDESESSSVRSKARKPRRWTRKLQQKFSDAVDKLGGVSEAKPKDILEMMGVKGLTRKEIVKHLKKVRMDAK